MISLLRKDILILRRSRLTVALLVLYPVAIALLIGLALSRGPAKPRVAVVNETAPGARVEVGGRSVDVSEYASQLFDQVKPCRPPRARRPSRRSSRATCSPPS